MDTTDLHTLKLLPAFCLVYTQRKSMPHASLTDVLKKIIYIYLCVCVYIYIYISWAGPGNGDREGG